MKGYTIVKTLDNSFTSIKVHCFKLLSKNDYVLNIEIIKTSLVNRLLNATIIIILQKPSLNHFL